MVQETLQFGELIVLFKFRDQRIGLFVPSHASCLLLHMLLAQWLEVHRGEQSCMRIVTWLDVLLRGH